MSQERQDDVIFSLMTGLAVSALREAMVPSTSSPSDLQATTGGQSCGTALPIFMVLSWALSCDQDRSLLCSRPSGKSVPVQNNSLEKLSRATLSS